MGRLYHSRKYSGRRDHRYVFFASADSPLTLNLVVGEPTPNANIAGAVTANAPVLAFVADAVGGVTGASVAVDVRLPNGSTGTPLALHDDGLNGDATANDGIYTGTLLLTQRGPYLLKAKATVGAALRYAQATLNY